MARPRRSGRPGTRPCHGFGRRCAGRAARSVGSSVTSGPGPCRVVYHAQHAQPAAPAPARLGEQRLGVGEGGGAPGRVRVEAVPLVEQHPLRALEDAGPGAQQPGAASCRPRSRPGRRTPVNAGRQSSTGGASSGPSSAVSRSRSSGRACGAAVPGGAQSPTRGASSGWASAYADGLADAHAAGAVPVGAPGQLPGPVGGPVVRRGEQRVPVDGEPVRAGRARPTAARWSASAASASGSTTT